MSENAAPMTERRPAGTGRSPRDGIVRLFFSGVFAVLAILSEYVILLPRMEEDRDGGPAVRKDVE